MACKAPVVRKLPDETCTQVTRTRGRSKMAPSVSRASVHDL